MRRLGIGRDHGKSLQPVVTIGGQTLKVPPKYKGPDQKDRGRFFGVLEIPVSGELIKSDNKFSISFPEEGCHVSSVALEVVEWLPL